MVPSLAVRLLTLYGTDKFFYDNPDNRYSLRSETGTLELNADGSIDLLVGPTAPSAHAANWLPSPLGHSC